MSTVSHAHICQTKFPAFLHNCLSGAVGHDSLVESRRKCGTAWGVPSTTICDCVWHLLCGSSRGCWNDKLTHWGRGKYATISQMNFLEWKIWILLKISLKFILKVPISTWRPRQNGHHFPDDVFKWIFLNENIWIAINISLKFVPWSPITVETLYSTIYYSKYFIELNIDKSTQYVDLWTHKRHPIPRPFRASYGVSFMSTST